MNFFEERRSLQSPPSAGREMRATKINGAFQSVDDRRERGEQVEPDMEHDRHRRGCPAAPPSTPETAPMPNRAGTTAKVPERRVEQRVRQCEHERRDRHRGHRRDPPAQRPQQQPAEQQFLADRRDEAGEERDQGELHPAGGLRARSRRPGADCRSEVDQRQHQLGARSRAPTPTTINQADRGGARSNPKSARSVPRPLRRLTSMSARIQPPNWPRSSSPSGQRTGMPARVAGDPVADRGEHQARRRFRPK